MKPVFGDTSYFLALVNARDNWHEQAVALSRHPPGPLLTTEWVLMELGNVIRRSQCFMFVVGGATLRRSLNHGGRLALEKLTGEEHT